MTICLSLRAKNPLCRDRHKTVLEFMLIPFDVDENHITRHTGVLTWGRFTVNFMSVLQIRWSALQNR